MASTPLHGLTGLILAKNIRNLQWHMKSRLRRLLAVYTLLVLAWGALPARLAADASKGGRPKIYDESLDGVKQLEEALVAAKMDNKHVLLQFGANWCGWCHKLHKLFETDEAIGEVVKANYVVVLVDVNKGHNANLVSKYRAEGLGLPCITILDSTGKHLTTKNTAELEEGDHHSPAKVLAFLKEWTPRK
ncbi:MAG TPA: thioredoxin family protein [Clostridia bacterium]|nr:thioredoxin family protein [Clostridia bacterium]